MFSLFQHLINSRLLALKRWHLQLEPWAWILNKWASSADYRCFVTIVGSRTLTYASFSLPQNKNKFLVHIMFPRFLKWKTATCGCQTFVIVWYIILSFALLSLPCGGSHRWWSVWCSWLMDEQCHKALMSIQSTKSDVKSWHICPTLGLDLVISVDVVVVIGYYIMPVVWPTTFNVRHKSNTELPGCSDFNARLWARRSSTLAS